MKKSIIIGLVIALSLALASVAIARGRGNCGNGPGAMANMTPQQASNFARFQTDTLPLRQKMMQLRTELLNLRVQAKPDWKAIAEKEKEMVDVRVKIREKASDAGLSRAGFGRGGWDCKDCGMGMGRGGRGMMGRM